jgi:tRNA pseudouridine55 synthase
LVPNARPRGRDVFGILLFDKPDGMSSNQAMQRVRRLFQAAKAGHTGSLDPLATGMLPICFGGATRLAGLLLDAYKEYRVAATLGVATTTGDAEGEITVDRSGEPAPGTADLAAALERFRGDIDQVPPMYSALKQGGVPLYRLARAGKSVERAARRVTIAELTLEDYAWPTLRLRVRCSKGTYIRTLVEDIAAALGTVGHVAVLRRLVVAPFRADEALHSLATLEATLAADGLAALDGLLLPPARALEGWARADVTATEAVRLGQGQDLPARAEWPAGPIAVFGEAGELLAIATVTTEGRLRPKRVFLR